MKKLNITKKQFGESKYFTNKYGTLKYVSESGKIFKTSKGHLLKFKEAKAKPSKYDGIANSWDKIKSTIETTCESVEEVAEKMKVIENITADAINSRIEAKKATSIAKKHEGETDYIDDTLKEIASKLKEDGPFFFAVADKGRKLGIVIDKTTPVTSQDDVHDAALSKLTDPKINAMNADLNRMSTAIITMLDEYSKKLVECGVIDGIGTPKKTTLKAQGIYDQDDDGKMTKIAEGRFSDMAKGAWRAIKGGAEKVWSWISETFFPQFIVKEEKFSDLVSRFDGYLGEVEGAIA